MSPDSLGWAEEWTPALRLFEDQVSRCKDLSQCSIRVCWLLGNKYLKGLKGFSRDPCQGEGDKQEALNWFLSWGLSGSSCRMTVERHLQCVQTFQQLCLLLYVTIMCRGMVMWFLSSEVEESGFFRTSMIVQCFHHASQRRAKKHWFSLPFD